MPRVRMPSLLAQTVTSTLILVVAAMLVLGGCGSGDRDGQADAPAAPPTPTTSSPAAPSPSAGPDRAPTAGAEHTRRPGVHKTGLLAPRPRTRTDDAAHLLTADRMPGLADGVAWTVLSTAPEDPAAGAAVGACQKTAVGAIGAVSSIRRTYDAPGGLRATQVVARFADAKSAWRAHQVLTAWRDDCAERLDYPHAEVGPLRTVRVRVGTGESYRAAYGPKARAAQRATGLGILRTGSYLTLVEVSAGPDGYPDRDPTRVAVRRISRTF